MPIGLFHNRDDAHAVVRELVDAGFGREDISMISQDEHSGKISYRDQESGGGATTGSGIGRLAGGLIGGLTDMGVSREDAEHYAEGVSGGATLVAVRTDAYERAENAAAIMEAHNAQMETAGVGLDSAERRETKASHELLGTRHDDAPVECETAPGAGLPCPEAERAASSESASRGRGNSSKE